MHTLTTGKSWQRLKKQPALCSSASPPIAALRKDGYHAEAEREPRSRDFPQANKAYLCPEHRTAERPKCARREERGANPRVGIVERRAYEGGEEQQKLLGNEELRGVR